MARRVSFLAKGKVKKRVTFVSRGRRVSFRATVPSKRRKKVTFYVTRH